MKKICSIIIISITCSCATHTKSFIQYGDKDEVIKNAILNFSSTSNQYKKDNVFFISVKDTNDIFLVTIMKNNMKVLVSTERDLSDNIPTKFIEKDSKLFLWVDKNYPLTDEALILYREYGILQDDEGGFVKFPDFVVDDAQKVTFYFFCKDNLRIFKKIVSNNGEFYYKYPKLKCN